MKGNIFSIEILFATILIASIVGLIYLETPTSSTNNFNIIKLNSNKINVFYFGEFNIQPQDLIKQNCGEIIFLTDENKVNSKNICEEIK